MIKPEPTIEKLGESIAKVFGLDVGKILSNDDEGHIFLQSREKIPIIKVSCEKHNDLWILQHMELSETVRLVELLNRKLHKS